MVNCSLSHSQCAQAIYTCNGNGDDASGNNNDATLVNGVSATFDLNGISGGALHFDGFDDYVITSDNFDFAQRTFALWFKAENVTSGIQILLNSDNPSLNYGNTVMWVQENSGVPSVGYVAGGQSSYFHYQPILENTWYAIAIVVNTDSILYYFNCEEIARFPVDYISSSDGLPNVKIGCGRNINNFFKGDIDYVQIYDCAKSQAEICALFTGIEDANNSIPITLYPNPTEDDITIQVNNPAANELKIEILNELGQAVQSTNIIGTTTIPTNKLADGMYFIRITGQDGVISTQRIVKQ